MMFVMDTRTRFSAVPFTGKGFFLWLNSLIAAHKSRIALANLDAAGLDDIGLTKHDVTVELSRSFWDIA